MEKSKYYVNEGTVKQLHSEGMTNRAIAKELDVPHWRIGKVIPKLGLKPNGRARGVREVDGDYSKCSVCGEWKLTETFPKNRQGTDKMGYLTYCRQCRTVQSKDLLNSDIKANFKERWRRCRDRALAKGYEFDLTPEHLNLLWDIQKGKCFYTDTPITYQMGEGRAEDSGLSIDRVDVTKGYTVGNVVLTTNRINRIKSDLTLEELAEWVPKWYQRVSER